MHLSGRVGCLSTIFCGGLGWRGLSSFDANNREPSKLHRSYHNSIPSPERLEGELLAHSRPQRGLHDVHKPTTTTCKAPTCEAPIAPVPHQDHILDVL